MRRPVRGREPNGPETDAAAVCILAATVYGARLLMFTNVTQTRGLQRSNTSAEAE